MWLRPITAERRGSRGFLLVEALVAVAVAGLLLTVLIRSFGATWSRGTLVREEAERMILARAILETATPRATLAPGLQEGVSGQYTWSVRIAQASPEATPLVPGRADIPLPKAVGPWQLYRVNILVTAASGRRTSLETYRIGRKTR